MPIDPGTYGLESIGYITSVLFSVLKWMRSGMEYIHIFGLVFMSEPLLLENKEEIFMRTSYRVHIKNRIFLRDVTVLKTESM